MEVDLKDYRDGSDQSEEQSHHWEETLLISEDIELSLADDEVWRDGDALRNEVICIPVSETIRARFGEEFGVRGLEVCMAPQAEGKMLVMILPYERDGRLRMRRLGEQPQQAQVVPLASSGIVTEYGPLKVKESETGSGWELDSPDGTPGNCGTSSGRFKAIRKRLGWARDPSGRSGGGRGWVTHRLREYWKLDWKAHEGELDIMIHVKCPRDGAETGDVGPAGRVGTIRVKVYLASSCTKGS